MTKNEKNLCRACVAVMAKEMRFLRQRNYVHSTAIKVYDLCRDYIEDGKYTHIFLLIFKLSQSPVDLITPVYSITPHDGTERVAGGGFIVRPTGKITTRTTVPVPIKSGSYYYELKLAKDAVFQRKDVLHIGWYDGRKRKRYRTRMGRDAKSWAWCCNGMLLHGGCVTQLATYQGGSGRGSDVLQYWRGGDVIGCGIQRSGKQFNILFYLNGKLVAEPMRARHGAKCGSWDIGTWDDWPWLFPCCVISEQHSPHHLVFGKCMQYLPNGFKPLYAEM